MWPVIPLLLFGLVACEETFCNLRSQQHICVPEVDYVRNCTCFLFPEKPPDKSRLHIPVETKVKVKVNSTMGPFLIWGAFNFVPIYNSTSFVLESEHRAVLDAAFPHEDAEVLRHPLPPAFDKTDFQESMGLMAFTKGDAPKESTYIERQTASRRLTAWCLGPTGCHVSSSRQIGYNRTTEIYEYAAEIVRMFPAESAAGGKAIVAAFSTVLARFQLQKVRRRICAMECRASQELSKPVCHNKCSDRYIRERTILGGRLKQSFQHFVRAMASTNFRRRYHKFVLTHVHEL